jgi:hypothetical protein
MGSGPGMGSDLIKMIWALVASGASLVEQEGQVAPGSHVKGIGNPAQVRAFPDEVSRRFSP